MSGDLRELLDDIAGQEVRGLRVDLAGATEQARNRRTRLRLVSSNVMMLAAAAAVLGVLLPVLLVVSTVHTSHRGHRRASMSQDWGWLPVDRTPSVTQVHMARARMLLAMFPQARVITDAKRSQPLHSTGRAPVVLSEDGKTYAALPWDKTAGIYTLSQDGTRVAWATVTVEAKRASIRVHQITLAQGTEHILTMPPQTWDERPTSLFFDSRDGHSLVIFTRSVLGVSPKQAHLWSWTPGSSHPSARQLCSCLPTPFGLDADGRPWQATNKLGHYPAYRRSPAVLGVPTWLGSNDIVTQRFVVSTTGRGVTGLGYTTPSVFHEGDHFPLQFTLTGPGTKQTITVSPPARGPAASPPQGAAVMDVFTSALDWTNHGIVTLYQPRAFRHDIDNSLLLVNPDSGRSRTIGIGDPRSIPLAVSTALTTGQAP